MTTDPTFDAFRRRLADAVTIAINNGVRVSADDPNSHCPIGCLPNAFIPRPGRQATELVGASEGEARAFMNAFDLGNDGQGYPEYAALGLAYRRRFP